MLNWFGSLLPCLPNLQMTHITLIYFVFSNCLVEKVCCGSLIFGIRHDGIEQLGPRLFSIWGNIFPFSVMGGSLERWQCCVLREVPLPHGLRPQTPFLCVGKAQTSVAYLCAAPAPPGRDHTHKCGSHMRFWEAKVSLNFINEGI